jgi:uncharacterized delta-60 repeat protein
MNNLFKLTYCFFLIALLASLKAESQTPGTLDPSFANNGVLILQPGTLLDNVNAIAVLPDDRIIAAGTHQISTSNWDIAVFRLWPDGALDTTFGINGYTFFDVAGNLDFGNCVAIEDDGKIIVGGGASINNFGDIDFFAARLMVDGALDPTFGTGGISQLHLNGGEDLFYNVALQSDGKIVFAGQDMMGGTTLTNPVLARLNANGSPDLDFGNNGFVVTDVNNEFNRFRDLVILGDGSIIGAGSAGSSLGYDILLIKYDGSGTPDNSFGTQGTALFNLNTGNDMAYSIMQHPGNGRILVAGQKGNGFTNTDFLLMSVKTNGTLDSSFAVNGIASLNVNTIDVASDMAIQDNGKIVLAGTIGGSGLGANDWAVARFSEGGTLDTGFGSNGYTITPVGSFFSAANSVALQSDGKIVTGGVAANTNNDMAVVRYFGDNTCSAPTAPVTSNITATSATFSWTSDADFFQVKYHPAIGGTWVPVQVPSGQTSVTVTGLQPHTRYIWTVRAKCGGSVTPFSSYVKFQTDNLRQGDITTATDVNVYPNPTTGNFALDLNIQLAENSIATIQVINALGQIVNSRTIAISNGLLHEEFSLAGNVAFGNYQVRIVAGDVVFTKQIMIQE